MSKIAEFNLKQLAEELELHELEFDAPSNDRVGDAPILDNGLNLMYAPQGSGKSYTAIAIAQESSLPSVFIDLESNGKMFVKHCKSNGVEYVYAGSLTNTIDGIKKLVVALEEKYHRVFIIIDSYSDLFPDDDNVTAKESQKQLGDLHRFFMRNVNLPILILDHATEQRDKEGKIVGFKIEGNKSGKFKKTVSVLRLETIGGSIDNGTLVTVERSRNHEELPMGHTQYYNRNKYLKNKLEKFVDEGKLNKEFSAKDLEGCLSGNDRVLWRKMRSEIATSSKKGRKEFWTLKMDVEA